MHSNYEMHHSIQNNLNLPVPRFTGTKLGVKEFFPSRMKTFEMKICGREAQAPCWRRMES